MSSKSRFLFVHGTSPSSYRVRNACIYGGVMAFWLVVDLLTKRWFERYAVGEVVDGPFWGIFQFRLVHNTGAAWGMFGNSTIILAVISLAVCIFLTIYLFVIAPNSSALTAFSLALICAGGVGNVIDRFTLGYVVDFIEPVLVRFPVFNIADVGVTCGFVLFLISIALRWNQDADEVSNDGLME